MTRKEKVKEFQKLILEWFSKNSRNFYWRNEKITIFEFIISEILLQRTKAEKVSSFLPSFFSVFHSWSSIATSDIKMLENTLKPLGLYKQRAQRIKKLADEIIELNEILPLDRKEIDKLSMFGQYIGNAIEIVLYKRRKALIDVNMSRVLERVFKKRKLSDIRYDPYLQKLSLEIVDHDKFREINFAILDFAALVCKPKPLCETCCLKSICRYYIYKIPIRRDINK